MTSPMTPGQARDAIDAAEGTTDYTWVDAHHALETVAGMREEWGVEFTAKNNLGRRTSWISRETDHGSYVNALRECGIYERKGMEPRLVRRYVTQVIDDE